MQRLPQRILTIVQGAGLALVVLAFLGLGIGSDRSMPSNARVFVNPSAGTYVAPPCISLTKEQERQWQDRVIPGVSYRDSMSALVAVTGLLPAVAVEVHEQKLRPDPECREEGAFMMEGRSLTGMVLERIGLLKPLPSRWNNDGSWNW